MNKCKECLEILIKSKKMETENCPECGNKSMNWSQNMFGTFEMECSNCGIIVAADLNTPCELDKDLHSKVRIIINPLIELPSRTIIYKLGKLLQLNVVQMKNVLESGSSFEVEHETLNKIIILLQDNNLENLISYNCDMKKKYPLYLECIYPYSAMNVYKSR